MRVEARLTTGLALVFNLLSQVKAIVVKKKLCVLTSLLMLEVLVHPALANAQSTRVVVSVPAAPVFAKPDRTMAPLRLAKEGSVLNVVVGEGEWYHIEFDDPQFGRRVGYIEKRHVSVQFAPAQQAVDLSGAQSTLSPQNRVESTQQQSDQVADASGISFFPATETAVGWSVIAHDPGAFIVGPVSGLGWMVSQTANLKPWLGMVGDVSGNYSSGTGLLGSTHSALAGVRFTGRPNGGRVNGFGQLLAGIQFSNVHGLGISDSLVNFAIQPGGGVDIKLSDSLALRMQLDYRTSFHDGFNYSAFRFAPGIVFSRGRKTF